MASWITASLCVVAIAVFIYFLYSTTSTGAQESASMDKCRIDIDELENRALREGITIFVPSSLPGSYSLQCAYIQGQSMNASLFYHQSSRYPTFDVEEFVASGGIVVSILKEDIPQDDPTFNNKMLHAESELMIFAADNTELGYIGANPAIQTSSEVIVYMDNNVMLDVKGALPNSDLAKIAESFLRK
jgi:hypothetical protein